MGQLQLTFTLWVGFRCAAYVFFLLKCRLKAQPSLEVEHAAVAGEAVRARGWCKLMMPLKRPLIMLRSEYHIGLAEAYYILHGQLQNL